MPIESAIGSVSVSKAIAAAENYTADDVISEHVTTGTAWTFADIVPDDGGKGRIIQAQALWETIGLTPALTIYLFTVVPTSNLDDNVANTAPIFADLANFIGAIDLPAMDNQGGMSEAVAVEGSGNLPMVFECASGANDIFGIVVCQANFTNEVATEQLTIKLTRELR